MDPPERRIDGLFAAIRRQFPDCDATAERFPSGAFTVDVRLNHRLFELTYSASQGFGIDEVKADGYAFAAATFEEAADRLVNLLLNSLAP